MLEIKLAAKGHGEVVVNPEVDNLFRPDMATHLGVTMDRSVFYRNALDKRVTEDPMLFLADLRDLYMAGLKQGYIVVVSNPRKPWIAKGFKDFFTKLAPTLEETTRYQRETQTKILAEKNAALADKA